MLKTLRYRQILGLSVLILFGCLGCAVRKGAVKKEATVEGGSRWLACPEVAAAGDLEILWETKLPMKKKENLEQLFIVGSRIYGLSDKNYLVALNRNKGNMIFSKPVAKTGLPVVGLELYGDTLFSAVGNKLVEMGAEFGTERSAERLLYGVTCPAVRNNMYFYIAGTDRRVHALQTEDKVEVFEVAADDDSMITSILADEDFVVFATAGGNVASIMPNGPDKIWQFDTAGAIAGEIVRDGDSLFFASGDTNVYKINILNGRLVWKYQSGAMLERSPRVGESIVCQYNRDEGLIAINKESGKVAWRLAEGVDLLSEAEGKSYVITKTGQLVVIKNKTGKKLHSVNFAGISKYITNRADSKIYIADEKGRVACLRPGK